MAQRYLNVAVKLADAQAKAGLKSLGASGNAAMVGLAAGAVAAAGAVTAIGIEGVKANIELNKLMAYVETLLGEGADPKRIYELKDAVQEMSGELGKSTDDLADGLGQVISAFGDSSAAVDQLRVSAKAAVAGTAETKDALNLISAVTKAYGDTTVSAQEKISDFAFMTVKLGQTTFPELAASIGKVTPKAASLGVSMNDLWGIISTATQVTGNTSEVMTQFRGVLKALEVPSGDLAWSLEQLGYKGLNAGKDIIAKEGLLGALKLVSDTLDTDVTKSMATAFTETEALTLATALMEGQYETAIEKIRLMGEAEGETQRAFEAQTGGINEQGFKLEQLNSKWKVFKQDLGEAAAQTGVLDWAISTLNNTVDGLNTQMQENSATMDGMRDIGAALGTVITRIGDAFKWLWDTSAGWSEAYYNSPLHNLNPMSWFESSQMQKAGEAGLGEATRSYTPGSGQYTPHSERGTSGVMHVIVDNADTGSMGLLEAISG